MSEKTEEKQPNHWKLVPREPTPEMIRAFRKPEGLHGGMKNGDIQRSYAAMFDACPLPPVMRIAMEQTRNEALQEAAKVAHKLAEDFWDLWKTKYDPNDQGRSLGAEEVANAIEALKRSS